jgi:hypothetical protein
MHNVTGEQRPWPLLLTKVWKNSLLGATAVAYNPQLITFFPEKG